MILKEQTINSFLRGIPIIRPPIYHIIYNNTYNIYNIDETWKTKKQGKPTKTFIYVVKQTGNREKITTNNEATKQNTEKNEKYRIE